MDAARMRVEGAEVTVVDIVSGDGVVAAEWLQRRRARPPRRP
jgi:hypothetical protein